MRYDEKISTAHASDRYNSGYESVGFDAFDRYDSVDALCCNAVSTTADTCLDWYANSLVGAQGTSSSGFNKITNSIATISSTANGFEKALKSIAAVLGCEFDDDWNLKEKHRGNRLLRSQLRTLQKGTL